MPYSSVPVMALLGVNGHLVFVGKDMMTGGTRLGVVLKLEDSSQGQRVLNNFMENR